MKKAIEITGRFPSIATVKNIRAAAAREGTDTAAFAQMLVGNDRQAGRVSFSLNELREYFPGNFSEKEIREAILDMLEHRARIRERSSGAR